MERIKNFNQDTVSLEVLVRTKFSLIFANSLSWEYKVRAHLDLLKLYRLHE